MMIDRRPPVSVVVPFSGDLEAATRVLAALAKLRVADGDEVVIADNSFGQVTDWEEEEASARFRVVVADDEASSYHARNAGAEAAANEWLLFIDADCVPVAGLIDEFFDPAPADSVGALAGAVTAAEGGNLIERWAASRRPVSQEAVAGLAGGPAAVTANLLVRRAAWHAVGGFCEGVRSGADLEFCWRLADAGWEIEHRPGAQVAHGDRANLGALLRQMRGYGAGNAWQNRRRPGASPRPSVARHVPRMVGGAMTRALRGRFSDAAMSAIDGLALSANRIGWLESNAAAAPAPAATGAQPVVVVVDGFPPDPPAAIEDDVRSLAASGRQVRVEAAVRPQHPRLGGARGLRVDYLEDEGAAQRLAAVVRLACSHPLRCARDLFGRRGGAAEERLPLRDLAPMAGRLVAAGDREVYAESGSPAASRALRAARLARVPVSVVPGRAARRPDQSIGVR